MRCGCPCCDAYMVHAEEKQAACCCPQCGYRCNACLGTHTVINRESLFSSENQDLLLRRLQHIDKIK